MYKDIKYGIQNYYSDFDDVVYCALCIVLSECAIYALIHTMTMLLLLLSIFDRYIYIDIA